MSPDKAGGRGVIYLSVGWSSLPTLLRRSGFGRESWYLRSTMSSRWGRRLLQAFDVRPVDLESIDRLPVGPASTEATMQRALDRLIEDDLDPLLARLAGRYPLAVDGRRILLTSIAKEVSLHSLDAYYAELWSRARAFDRVFFVGASVWDDMLLSDRDAGRRVIGGLSRTLSVMGVLCRVAARMVRRTLSVAVAGSRASSQMSSGPPPVDASGDGVGDSSKSVLYILNNGLSYGSLYAYDHMLSDDESSVMHPRNVVVMARTGGPGNAEGIVYAYPVGGSQVATFHTATRLSYRALREFGARYAWRYVWFLAKFCAAVDGQRTEIANRYPSVRTAVLAYEVQVPTQLVLALEAEGIRTVAFNERPLSVLQETQPFAVSTLLTASPYFSEAALRSRSVAVRDAVPLGLWRTDLLRHYQGQPPHELLLDARRSGRRFIVALPYEPRTRPEWGGNPLVTSPYAVAHFLTCMVDLAAARPDLQVVVRGKSDSWCEEPPFAEIARRIDLVENICVSHEYERLNESYRLCANADLVIAKYTSLVDEALALGIPCVVHDFSPNASGAASGIARHLPAGVWAENQEQLTERISFALRDGGEAFREWWEDHRLAIYGDANDGRVRERALTLLEGLAWPNHPDCGRNCGFLEANHWWGLWSRIRFGCCLRI